MKFWDKLDKYLVVVADKSYLEIDLPGDEGQIAFQCISDGPVIVHLVNPDGVVLPMANGNEVSIKATYLRGWKLSLQVKKGQTVTYLCKLVPRRIFEVVDPTPVSISRHTSVKPSVPQAFRDYLDARLRQLGINVPVNEILEDVDDPDLDLGFEDDGDWNFGEGFMEADEADVPEAPPAPAPAAAPAEPAPGAAPPAAPSAPPQPVAPASPAPGSTLT